MCFARTCPLLERVDEHVWKELPFHEYSLGCHLISTVAADILNKHGVECKIQMCALWKDAQKTWIPHWVVVTAEGDILDFKRRCYGIANPFTGKNESVGMSDSPVVQLDGFYPTDKQYKLEPNIKMFEITHQ